VTKYSVYANKPVICPPQVTLMLSYETMLAAV